MSRCIVVVALPRTGSSAVAGAMHRLGVHMGDDLQPADILNRKGYYEDRLWQRINKDVAGYGYDVHEVRRLESEVEERYRKVIQHYDERYSVWGFKNPRACFTLPFIWPLLDGIDTRVVHVQRDFETVVRSLHRHSQIAYSGTAKMTEDEARSKCNVWREAEYLSLTAFDGPMTSVQFENLLDNPMETLSELSDFCFGGLEQPNPMRLEMAVGFIDSELVTCD